MVLRWQDVGRTRPQGWPMLSTRGTEGGGLTGRRPAQGPPAVSTGSIQLTALIDLPVREPEGTSYDARSQQPFGAPAGRRQLVQPPTAAARQFPLPPPGGHANQSGTRDPLQSRRPPAVRPSRRPAIRGVVSGWSTHQSAR